MIIKYITIIFSLITLTGASCHGAACWPTSHTSNAKKIENIARKRQIDYDQAELFMAAIDNNVAALEHAIRNGVHVDTCDKDGNTPLMEAAARNKAEAVQALLNAKADTSLTNNKGEAAINIAYTKNAQAVKPILRKAERIQDILQGAAAFNNIDELNQAIRDGANVNTPDEFNLTALHRAASWGHTTIIIELLNQRAHTNKTDRDGRTPLMMAAARDDGASAVQALLDGQADISLTNKNGETALDIAKKHNRYEIISILENGDDRSVSQDESNSDS